MSQKLTFLCMLAVLVLGGPEAQTTDENYSSSPDQRSNAHKRLVEDIFQEMLANPQVNSPQNN
jgi:hypothetical protein